MSAGLNVGGVDFLQSVFNLISNDHNEDGPDRSGGRLKRKQKRSVTFDEDGAERGKHKKKRVSEDYEDEEERNEDNGSRGGNSQVECDTTGQGSSPTQLQEKIQQKIQAFKGKRTKSRDEILARRRDKKKNKKTKKTKNKSNMTKNDIDAIAKSPATKSGDKPKPTFNRDGKLVFSKFDFSDDKRKKPRAVSGLMGKDYKKILETLEKRKEKIESLKGEDEGAAHEMSQRAAYDVAISKARGVTIKDDAMLVKRAMKKKEQRQKKTQTTWKQRVDTVNRTIKEKQDRRTRNIDARKQQNIDTKVKRAKKRGHVAGF